jgi:hypothetical protein
MIETCEFPNNISPRESAGEKGKLTRDIQSQQEPFVNMLLSFCQ